jgi:predicted TIM-barrel fold metal-dependent hydrolase
MKWKRGSVRTSRFTILAERAQMMTRREWLAGAAFTASAAAARPAGVLIESHVHLFAGDPVRFPYSGLSYKPHPSPVEAYVKFALAAKIDHAIIVHPEPYQADHRYLEYCLGKEPSKGFFKATCLFDPIDPATPKRMRELIGRNPDRIVALRIHEVHVGGTPSTTKGLIGGRDLRDPQMELTWRAAHELELGIQMHFIPYYADQIRGLAAKFPQMPVILDHLARPGQGTAAEYEQVLKLAELPRLYMKYTSTGVESAGKDAKPLVKRVYDAFGADRMIWGGLGASLNEFEKAAELFNTMFDFAPEPGRAKIRGLTARKLFGFVR